MNHSTRRSRGRWLRSLLVIAALLLILRHDLAEITAGVLTLSAQRSADAAFALIQLNMAQTLAPHLPFAASQESYLLGPQQARNSDSLPLNRDQPYAPALNNEAVLAASTLSPLNLLPLFERAVQVQPESAQAQYNLGVTAYQAGDYEAAQVAFRQTSLLAPTWPMPHAYLATVYIHSGAFAPATDAAKAALRLDPRLREAHLTLLLALFSQQQTEEGLAAAGTALSWYPQDATLLLYQGLFLRAAGEPEAALSTLRMAFFAAQEEPLRRRIAEEILAILSGD